MAVRRPGSDGRRIVARAARKLGLLRSVRQSGRRAYFCPLMGLVEIKLFPTTYFAETLPYCFDCWPAEYSAWEAFLTRHRVRLAFFSASGSATEFEQRLPSMGSIWLPEATDPAVYRSGRSLIERAIDLLELGRRHDRFHDLIRSPLEKLGRVHLFERAKGDLVFPSRDDLVAGLADSRVSVCFPSSETHRLRSGDVETATHRYFEPMASKCIVLGSAPSELVDM